MLLAAALAACNTSGAPDAGTPGGGPSPDGGDCAPLCDPPDGGECVPAGAACDEGGSCCPGVVCDAGLCVPPVNPCLNGEELLASGCGCDPTLPQCPTALLQPTCSCYPGFFCGTDLHCEPDAGFAPLPPGQPVGAPCEPSSFAGAGPACAQGAGPLPVDCVLDPSGVNLYVCEQACRVDADCSLAWQSCNSPWSAAGHCGDTPCGTDGGGYLGGCRLGGGAPGVCLPFSYWVEQGGGDAGLVTYGICLQSSPDAGVDAPCGTPPSRGDGGLCDPAQVCVAGQCRFTCNAADGGAAGVSACPNDSYACVPADLQASPAGAPWVAGGCVPACELDGGCDGGTVSRIGGGDGG